MNIFNRAKSSLWRQKGKTISYGIALFILGLIMGLSILTKGAISNTKYQLWAQVPPVAHIATHPRIMEEFRDALERFDRYGYNSWDPSIIKTDLTIEQLQKIMNLPQFSFFNVDRQARLESVIYSTVTLENNFIMASDGFVVNGISTPQFTSLAENRIEIVEGRNFSTEEATSLEPLFLALVSEKLAEENNWTVGSSFEMAKVARDARDEKNFPQNLIAKEYNEFKIIGIFQANLQIDMGYSFLEKNLKRQLINRIYMPLATIDSIRSFENYYFQKYHGYSEDEKLRRNNWISNTFFHISSSNLLPQFLEEANIILYPDFIMQSFDNFNHLSTLMETMDWFAARILWGAFGGGILVITLLTILCLHDRKKEMGIYLALGEKRSKVVIQILLEALSLGMLSFIGSFFIAYLLGNLWSEEMIRQQLEIAFELSNQQIYSTQFDLLRMRPMDIEEMAKSFQIVFSPFWIVIYFTITFGSVLISVLLGSSYLLNLEPKKILM